MLQNLPHKPDTQENLLASRGYILAFTVILILGVTAISVGTMYNGKMGRSTALSYKHKLQAFSASDGLMTLLAQELINGQSGRYVDTTRMRQISGKKWNGIPGDLVSDLKNHINYINNTGYTTVTSNYLGSAYNEDNYGIKWTGWIVPPISGNYYFITRSDNESKFYLSTDATVGNLSSSPICRESGPDYSNIAWKTSAPNKSVAISLVAGNRYYFEYYHKEGIGGDYGQMGWDGPENFSERPITGRYISQYASDTTWAGKVLVGLDTVRYQVLGAGMDKYRIFTEAIDTRKGSAKDTSFRAPLTQLLSMKGPITVPPTKIKLPVIYYDYRADAPNLATGGSNPEFEILYPGGWVDGLTLNMVQSTLTFFTAKDAAYFGRATIPKPRRNLITPNRNCGLNMWFQDWVPVSWVYNYSTPSDCATHWDSRTDRWANWKVKDSLAFILDESQGPSTYVYDPVGGFFPLDGKPFTFGIQPVSVSRNPDQHNFAFCTELHTTFIHQSGLKFEFTGDDDVWVFINNKLVIDLGGLHPATSAFLYLDNLTGLTFGGVYNFDFYQCERHTHQSNCRIATNIKMTPPTGVPVAGWKRDYGSLD